MVVAVLAPFAAGDASRYAALAAVLGVLVGAICFWQALPGWVFSPTCCRGRS